MEPQETPSRPVLRRVRAGDAAELRALRLEMLADTPIAYVETVAQAAAHPLGHWTDRAARGAAGCRRAQFIVEADGRWIATGGGFASENGRTIVVGVYITPSRRGAGVLAQLIDAVAHWSLECGREQLALEVAKENPRARTAYERLGFVLTGAEHPHPLYPDVTELEMARPARHYPESSTDDAERVRHWRA